MKKAVLILAPGFEEVEAITVIDLLRRAEIELTTASIADKIVTGSHNIKIYADVLLSDLREPDYDILILPGGPGTKHLRDSEAVLDLVKKQNAQQKWVAAICAAPTVLEKAGILHGKSVTSFPAEKGVFNNSIYKNDPVVKDGNIITSRGAGTAVDFSLALIAVLKGRDVASEIADRIVYKNSDLNFLDIF